MSDKMPRRATIKAFNVSIENDLDVGDCYGLDFTECDTCGKRTHPKDVIIVASTDGERSGVYCRDCQTEQDDE